MRSILCLMLGISLLGVAPRTASAVQLRLFDFDTIPSPSLPRGLLLGSGGDVPEISPGRQVGEFFASYGAGLGLSTAGAVMVGLSDLASCGFGSSHVDPSNCFLTPAMFEAMALMLPAFLTAHISAHMAETDGYRYDYFRVLGWSLLAHLPFAVATVALSLAASRLSSGDALANCVVGAVATWLGTFIAGAFVEIYVAHSGPYDGVAPAADPPAQTQLEGATIDRPWAVNESRTVINVRPVMQVPVVALSFY